MGNTQIHRHTHKKKNGSVTLLAFLALLGAFLIAPSSTNTACAGAGEITGCGTDTWTAMVNQSLLQTRREVVMNQRYIAKADSVLAYSCFEQMTADVGAIIDVFSGSDRWENAEIDIIGDVVYVTVGPFDLDAAIESAVLAPLETYLDLNFNHPWLGGLLAPGVEEFFQSGHPCGTMRQVWQMAKCMNVTDDPLFYRFEDLIEYDPREYPANMICEDTGITQEQIDIARGSETAFNDIIPHLEMVDPEEGCYKPIPTGVTIVRRTGAGRISEEVTYEDALCMTAGCSYQNAGTAGLGTCQIRE